MFVRYGILVTIAAAALIALVKIGGSSSEWVLVDAGDSTGSVTSGDFDFWLLASIASLTAISLCRFVVFSVPSMLGVWYEARKEWLYSIAFGAMAFGAYYFM